MQTRYEEGGMIHKDNLKGKYVTFFDKYHAQRTQKVVKINGRTLTVKDATGKRTRIHPDKNKILGRQLKRKIEEIDWK